MDIQTQIRPELWNAIANSYQAENYTNAVRDAMALVTEILRDKAGVDDDGKELVGKALGFSKEQQPRIRINKLQTETERNMQIGLQEILKGMYGLIRNPRSHERIEDNKKTADAIILFVDYLLSFLGASEQSFTVENFYEMVADPYFVGDDEEYINGMIEKIPARRRIDALIYLYQMKDWKLSNKIKLMVTSLIEKLAEGDIDDFIYIVSDELQTISNEESIRLILKILPVQLWNQVAKMPRIRIENILLNALAGARYDLDTHKPSSRLCETASKIAVYFLRKDKLREVILDSLRARNFAHHDFIGHYLMKELPKIFNDARSQMESCVKAICECIRCGNEFMKSRLIDSILEYPTDWQFEFQKNLEDLTDPEKPEIRVVDGKGILGKFIARPNPAPDEENIPF